MLVMISCFHFFCNMRSGIFQVFCNATQFENYIRLHTICMLELVLLRGTMVFLWQYLGGLC